MEIIFALIAWVIFLIGAVKFAASRGRSQFVWVCLVAAFPPALIILILMPSLKTISAEKLNIPPILDEFLRRCTTCNNLVDAEKDLCPICGEA